MAESSAGLQRLAPFVLGRARRGVVGSSRYAHRLRTAVLEAARDPHRQPVLIIGEPGLEKDNLAALVHYGSGDRRRLLVRLDASDLQGSSLNLLNELGSNTLLVSGMDRVEGEVQQRLIAMARGEAPGFQGRVLFTSEAAIPALDGLVRTIRVPPLRVRRTDLGDWLRYRLRLQSPGLGWSPLFFVGCASAATISTARDRRHHELQSARNVSRVFEAEIRHLRLTWRRPRRQLGTFTVQLQPRCIPVTVSQEHQFVEEFLILAPLCHLSSGHVLIPDYLHCPDFATDSTVG